MEEYDSNLENTINNSKPKNKLVRALNIIGTGFLVIYGLGVVIANKADNPEQRLDSLKQEYTLNVKKIDKIKESKNYISEAWVPEYNHNLDSLTNVQSEISKEIDFEKDRLKKTGNADILYSWMYFTKK